MRKDLICRRTLVEAHKAVQQIVACSIVVAPALVVREVVLERRARELLREEIDFVEEEDD